MIRHHRPPSLPDLIGTDGWQTARELSNIIEYPCRGSLLEFQRLTLSLAIMLDIRSYPPTTQLFRRHRTADLTGTVTGMVARYTQRHACALYGIVSDTRANTIHCATTAPINRVLRCTPGAFERCL
jgi:hypothetical protein